MSRGWRRGVAAGRRSLRAGAAGAARVCPLRPGPGGADVAPRLGAGAPPTMKRRHVARGLAAAWALGGLPAWAAADDGAAPAAKGGTKTLRYAFSVAETGFDPAQLSDLYSRIVTLSGFWITWMGQTL